MEVLQWIQVAQQGVMIEEIRDDIRYIKGSAALPNEDNAAFLELAYGSRLEVCQEGTRTAILERIRRWIADENTQQPIFSLMDLAGTGKSTIAATVAIHCLETGQL